MTKKVQSVTDAFIAEFIYNSNGIEGIHTPIEAVKPDCKHPLISNHIEAVNYVLENYKDTPTLGQICTLHSILMKNVDRYAGTMRTFPVYIGGDEAPKAGAVPYLLENWLQLWNKKPYKTCTKNLAVQLRHY